MQSDLVVRARHGDKEAFAAIVSAIDDRFHAVAYRVLRDRHLAEDAAQSALVRVWRDLPRLRDPERFEAWSYRILLNACHSEARRMRRWLPPLAARRYDEPVAPDDLGAVADRELLERGFQHLPVDQRVVIVLRHYLGMTEKQVAEIVGAPVGTVHTRHHHGMRTLRAALEADARKPAHASNPPEVSP